MSKPLVSISIGTKLENSQASCVYNKVILKYGVPIQEQLSQENTIYVVKWNHSLNAQTLTVPHNCILEFEGGKLANGTVVWDNTKVLNRYGYAILDNIAETGSRTTSEGKFQ